ncbi:hypothetical protein BDZ94DRAFT_1203581 [Collybia nuda]|uniref:BRCT domain-containing protein n=1 Tax=Collybia nuda TaxID=64659 RepID=A0A9P5XUG2_9AGAR|nr:hypothetical protein BDZ94DRAFT_1203581 [Collybia nuda]
MSEPVAPEKRTRSQLTLPDDILQQLSQRSPLKDARTALRNNTYNILEPTPHISTGNTEGTDDELLLTSRTPNVHFSTKRSASPLRDEYSSRSESLSEGRELKRLRRGLDDESSIAPKTTPYITPFNHIRSHSQPNIQLGKKGGRCPTADPPSSKPVSSSDTRSPTSFVSRSKGRAQSVPLFTIAPAVPHLDLRNPPPSPTRARSRSPFKFGENIKTAFEVNLVAKLDINGGPSMVVDSTEPPNGLPSLNLRTPALPDAEETLLPPSALEVVMEINLSGHLSHKPPSTPPPTERLLSTHLWSPLTPLPETPHPSKNLSDTEGRCTSLEREIERVGKAEEREMATNNILHRTRYARADIDGKSRLTHVSNTNRSGVTSTTMVPPAFQATNTKRFTSLKNQSGPSSNLVKPSLGIVKRSAETPGDAFAVLMAQARLDKVGDRSKGASKGKMQHKKAAPSSALLFNTSQFTRAKGNFQSTSKELGNQSKTKPSLKAKMKPKQMPKAKPIPVPIPDSTQDDLENTSMPLNTPPLDIPAEQSLPVSSSNSSARPNPKQTNDSILRSTPPKTIVHSALLLSGIRLPHPKVIGPKVVENLPMAETSTRDAADAGVYFGNPLQPRTSPSQVSTTVTSKLPRAKRVPSSTTVENATRRVSSRLKGKDATMINAITHTAKTTKQTTNRKKPPQSANISTQFTTTPEVSYDTTASTSGLSDVPSDSTPDNILPPGSPMKIDSPMRKGLKEQEHLFVQSGHSTTTKAALSRTPSKPKNKSKSESPSPSKLSRSTSMFSVRTTALSRTFTNYGGHSGQSSLSTLSNALEKLRMPPPARPNTSMGFNRDSGKADDTTPPIRGTDDLPWDGSSRMVEHNIVLDPGALRDSSGGQSIKAKNPEPGGRKPAPMFNSTYSMTRLQSGTGPIMRSIGSGKVHGGRPIFGTGGRPFGAPGRLGALQKVSRKTSLPSVMASPVKSSYAMDSTSGKDEEVDRVPNNQSSLDQGTSINHTGRGGSSGRESYIDTHRSLASRRASLASQALSQSLSSLPLSGEYTAGAGSMGPPATPLGHNRLRATTSNNPTTSLPPFSGRNSGNEMVLKTKGTVKSVNDTLGKPEEGVNGRLFSGRNQLDGDGVGSSNFNSELLKVLQDCIIFVDVRTDDGDEAGSLFVEMLESVGARILTRVGQTCTHIVYKNGLVSTTTRYRLLRDPKPLVVGIAWVVECVEQRQRVDESKFAIDLDNINVAGVNRRRRSMLPKAIIREIDDMNNDREGDGDQSIDGSTLSMIMNDGLTPLEKARRRKGAQ